MDVSLSDLLVCPRCGPTYGLVLMPYESAERRVRSGVLGCANCRERYPIVEGVADLRVGATEGGAGLESRPASSSARSEAEEPVRLAGLMGLAGAHGTVLVAGPAAEHAGSLAELVPDVEVVGVAARERMADVSWLRVTTVLPFRTGSLRGVALTGSHAGLVEEGARVLGATGRLVLDPAPPDAGDRLAAAGLSVAAEEGSVVVAVRPE